MRAISGVTSLPSLQALHLSGNRVADLAELEWLASAQQLVEISLTGAHCTLCQSRIVPWLRVDVARSVAKNYLAEPELLASAQYMY